MIRNATINDAKAICEIYNYYIENSICSFEESLIDEKEMGKRISLVIDNNYVWLVYEEDNQIMGYAYANKWMERSAYRFCLSVSVYLKPKEAGNGIGSNLYKTLFSDDKLKGKYHAVIAGIALPNDSSIYLHEKFDFKKIAHFKQVGFKFNKWIDVAYWQRYLDK